MDLAAVYPTIAEDEVEADMAASRENLVNAVKRAKAGETMRLWVSDSPDETAGLYWLMSQFAAAGVKNPDVTLVRLPDYAESFDGTVVQYTG